MPWTTCMRIAIFEIDSCSANFWGRTYPRKYKAQLIEAIFMFCTPKSYILCGQSFSWFAAFCAQTLFGLVSVQCIIFWDGISSLELLQHSSWSIERTISNWLKAAHKTVHLGPSIVYTHSFKWQIYVFIWAFSIAFVVAYKFWEKQRISVHHLYSANQKKLKAYFTVTFG